MTTTTRSPARRPEPRDPRWRKPDHLVQIDASDLVNPREASGRTWYFHAVYGELEELRTVTEDRLPADGAAASTWIGGERRYRTFRIHPAGTLDALAATRPPYSPRRLRDAALVDQLAPLMDGRTGVDAIIARLRRRGASVCLAGGVLHVLAPGGALSSDARELARAAAPLLEAFLRDGVAPLCSLGCGSPAITVAMLDHPWCGACGPDGAP